MNKVPITSIQGMEIPIMCLGTVQLGLEYGVANKSGKPSPDKAFQIMEKALSGGVTHFDTATAYGNSEQIIGAYIDTQNTDNIILTSKLLPGDYDEKNISQDVTERVQKSLKNLNQEQIDYFLLHDWDDYHLFDNQIWQNLIDFKNKGVFNHLGASIYTPEQGMECLNDDHVEFLQIPLNILDHRWRNSDFVQRVQDMKKENKDRIFIQARSVFLQGLLTGKTDKFPVIEGFDKNDLYKKLDDLTQKFSRKSWMDLSFAYINALDWVDNVVLGVETPEQLQGNYNLCFEPKLNNDQIEEIERTFLDSPEMLLNPSQWQL